MSEEIGGITRKDLLIAMKLIPKLSAHKEATVLDFLTRQALMNWRSEYDKWAEKEDPEQI